LLQYLYRRDARYRIAYIDAAPYDVIGCHGYGVTQLLLLKLAQSTVLMTGTEKIKKKTARKQKTVSREF